MTGSAFEAMDVVGGCLSYEMGGGLEEGGLEIRRDRRPADDGKRFCGERCVLKGLNGKGFGEGVVQYLTSPALGGLFRNLKNRAPMQVKVLFSPIGPQN